MPPYAVRVSSRSRRVRLVITPETGLTVVTPPGFDPRRVPGIVLDRLDWVNHHLQRVQTLSREDRLPPASVELLAVGRVLAVRYRAGGGRGSAPGTAGNGPAGRMPAREEDARTASGLAGRVAGWVQSRLSGAWAKGQDTPPHAGAADMPGVEGGLPSLGRSGTAVDPGRRAGGAGRSALGGSGPSAVSGSLEERVGKGGTVRVRAVGPASLEVSGDIARRDLVDEALRGWLKREAARLLPPLLAEAAGRLGLGYTSVTIRLQRTRWGSCSAKGGISLNARLLFLPPELAGYVLAHELAHTVHLNHSPAYWRFLESLSPGALVLDRELRNAGRYVPAWARG